MSRTQINTRLLGAGSVRNVTFSVHSTRTTISSAASIPIHSFNVNKLSSTSNLLVMANISGFAFSESRHQSVGVKFGAGAEIVTGNAGYFVGTQTGMDIPVHVVLAGHATTGTQSMVIRFFSQDAAAARTLAVLNPNSTDDSRLGQTRSSFTVIEYEP